MDLARRRARPGASGHQLSLDTHPRRPAVRRRAFGEHQRGTLDHLVATPVRGGGVLGCPSHATRNQYDYRKGPVVAHSPATLARELNERLTDAVRMLRPKSGRRGKETSVDPAPASGRRSTRARRDRHNARARPSKPRLGRRHLRPTQIAVAVVPFGPNEQRLAPRLARSRHRTVHHIEGLGRRGRLDQPPLLGLPGYDGRPGLGYRQWSPERNVIAANGRTLIASSSFSRPLSTHSPSRARTPRGHGLPARRATSEPRLGARRPG